MKDFKQLILAFTYYIILTLLGGLMVYKIWIWIMIPAFDFIYINYWSSVGIFLIIELLKHRESRKKITFSKLNKSFITGLITIGVFLLSFYLISLFI